MDQKWAGSGMQGIFKHRELVLYHCDFFTFYFIEIKSFDGAFSIKNEEFTDSLKDPNNPEYTSKAKTYGTMVRSLNILVIYYTLIFYILWKKCRLKSTFLPYHVKKNHSTLEMDTFKIMLLLSYLASLDNKPRT